MGWQWGGGRQGGARSRPFPWRTCQECACAPTKPLCMAEAVVGTRGTVVSGVFDQTPRHSACQMTTPLPRWPLASPPLPGRPCLDPWHAVAPGHPGLTPRLGRGRMRFRGTPLISGFPVACRVGGEQGEPCRRRGARVQAVDRRLLFERWLRVEAIVTTSVPWLPCRVAG